VQADAFAGRFSRHRMCSFNFIQRATLASVNWTCTLRDEVAMLAVQYIAVVKRDLAAISRSTNVDAHFRELHARCMPFVLVASYSAEFVSLRLIVVRTLKTCNKLLRTSRENDRATTVGLAAVLERT